MKVKYEIKKTIKLEGDFYVVYFKDGKSKGYRHCIYFANDEKLIKKAENQAHGEPVIVEKMSPGELAIVSNKLKYFLKKQVTKNEKTVMPICVAMYG